MVIAGKEVNCMKDKIGFGNFITKKRKENNLTQKELAEKLYVSESAVSKWERGLSYPDISLISDICDSLKISEHELITASEDLHQHQIEKQALKFRHVMKTYKMTFYIIYAAVLLICFICNVASSHTLSWFFIVLTAISVAFSLTSLPLLFSKNRGLITLTGFFISLNALLLVCCIYTGGNWFGVSFTSLLFSFSVVFMPYVLRNIEIPQILYSNKALTCFFVNTLLLFVMLLACSLYQNYMNHFFTVVCPVALVALILPWFFLIIIRYMKFNAFFKAAICFIANGVYVFLANSVLAVIIDNKPFALQKYNFKVWKGEYVNGNIILAVTIVSIIMAAFLSIGGIMFLVKRKSDSNDLNQEI